MTRSESKRVTFVVGVLVIGGFLAGGIVLGDEKIACVRIGHRGAPTLAPENTLASARAAVKAGVDGIEFDVWYTADRKMIVIHDGDLRRTTNGGNARVPTLARMNGHERALHGPRNKGS